jgi:hypothetical protein
VAEVTVLVVWVTVVAAVGRLLVAVAGDEVVGLPGEADRAAELADQFLPDLSLNNKLKRVFDMFSSNLSAAPLKLCARFTRKY